MNKKFVSLVSDTTFKYLFKNSETRYFLEEIILNKTGIDLRGYELVDNEDNTGNHVKDYRMDLVLKKENEFIIIEMNNEYSMSSEIKGRQYLYRKASFGYDKGEKFQNAPNVKLIMFNNYYHRKYRNIKNIKYSLCNNEYNLQYTDIEIYEIYLKAFNKLCYDKYSEIDKSLCLFGIDNFEEMRVLIKDEKNIKILKELERLSMDENFIDDYDYEHVQKKLMNSIRYEGYEEGYEDSIKSIVTKMLSEKFDVETISKVTNLSVDEINDLKQEDQK